jgi:uncharacterized protein YkwD
MKCLLVKLWFLFPLALIPSVSCENNPTSSLDNNHLNDLAKEVHKLVNLHRTSMGLPQLEWSEIVAEECRAHSDDMANSGTINHDGFHERIDRIKEKVSLKWAGENVALNWSTNAAVESWLNSPGHKSNIESNSDLTGVGVAFDENSAMYFTQIFVTTSK